MLAITKLTFADRIVMSALPLKADMCAAKSDVGFTPNSHRESGFPATGMSALPPKVDMCSAIRDVRYGPIADIDGSLDQPVSDLLNVRRHFEAERLGSLEIDQ